MNNEINTEKKSILKRISKIDSMRKGSISEQIIKTTKKDGTVKMNGPYLLLTTKGSDGKTVTESIPEVKLDFYRQEIENYKEFKILTNRYEALSEESSKLKACDDLAMEKQKKT